MAPSSTVHLEPHPLLDAALFVTALDEPLGHRVSPPGLADLLSPEAPAPLQAPEGTRTAIRDLLRHGGFKPAGRSKPASEYLAAVAAKGVLGPINPLVDACNVASLHSGLPISVVDLDRATPPLRVALAPKGASAVFNASGQVIDLSGLLCLWDTQGPCANAVKDAQRTKTHEGTRRTLSVVWGTTALPGHAAATAAWYRQLLETHLGARTTPVP